MRKRRILSTVLLTFIVSVLAYLVIFLYSPHSVADFLVASDNRGVYLVLKPFGLTREVTGNHNHKSDDLQWSPGKSFVSFFERVLEPAEKPYDREWALKTINPRTLKMRTVFIGNSKTGEYQWLDEKTIRIFMNGGTGVRIYRDIDITASEPFVAAEYWSPEFWTPIKL